MMKVRLGFEAGKKKMTLRTLKLILSGGMNLAAGMSGRENNLAMSASSKPLMQHRRRQRRTIPEWKAAITSTFN